MGHMNEISRLESGKEMELSRIRVHEETGREAKRKRKIATLMWGTFFNDYRGGNRLDAEDKLGKRIGVTHSR